MAPTTQLALTPNITMVDRTITTTTHHEVEEEESALNTAPPPPYTDADDEGNGDSDSDSDSDPQDIWERPQKLTINAGRTITGVGNLVSPSSLTELAEANAFGTTLLAVISQLKNSASAGGRGRRLNVDLTINCGIMIVGHKNVVGIPMRRNAEGKFTPSAPEATGVEAAVGGAKRKAEDEVSPVLIRLMTFENCANDDLFRPSALHSQEPSESLPMALLEESIDQSIRQTVVSDKSTNP
jgi:hypothetical protein